MHWNEGYHTDLTYTHGYYGEMNPLSMRFLLLASGIVPPDVTCACELGYGQGISLNIHAAAGQAVWYGADFNPAQASFAQQMGKISGARVYGDSFQELLERPDLPDFDYIALHGIWSWIAPAVQRSILEIIDKKLRPGGVVYISYNSQPGWAAFQPMRDLMKLYIDSGAHGDAAAQAREAFAFAGKLLDLNAAYGSRNPDVKKRIDDFSAKDPAYLAHEFFNEVWEINSFADMAAKLSEARLTYACSAQPLLSMGWVGLTQEQKDFLGSTADPVLRETALDFLRNTRFRKDYWIKGRRPTIPSERLVALREQCVVLLAPVDKLEKQIKVDNASATLSDASLAVFAGVLGDGKPHSMAELEKAARDLAARNNPPDGADKENLNTITQTVIILMAARLLAVAQAKPDITRARVKTEKLNAFIEARAVDNGQIGALASPVLGGGIGVGRFEQLFLLAYARGAKTADVMGSLACNALLSVGQRLTEGEATLDPDAMRARLQETAGKFLTERLSTLKNLQVA